MKVLMRQEDYHLALLKDLIPNANRVGAAEKELIQAMMHTPWRTLVPMDQNRVSNAVYYRGQLVVNYSFDGVSDPELVSVFEVFAQVSREYAFGMSMTPTDAALSILNDLKTHGLGQNPDEVVANLVARNYFKSGQGGFFPLKMANFDQTQVEIWYQMQQKICENLGIGQKSGQVAIS